MCFYANKVFVLQTALSYDIIISAFNINFMFSKDLCALVEMIELDR